MKRRRRKRGRVECNAEDEATRLEERERRRRMAAERRLEERGRWLEGEARRMKCNPIELAVQQRSVAVGVLEVLLEREDACIEGLGMHGETPLICAATYDREDVVEVLLNHGANPNGTSHRGNTPLHFAAGRGHPIMARLLVARGANVDAIGEHQSTPLHEAAAWAKPELVSILLESGASVEMRDADLRTPLHRALFTTWQHEDVVHRLLDCGANVDAMDKDGATPLHLAAHGGHSRWVCVNLITDMLSRGSDPEATMGESALTVLQCAVRTAHGWYWTEWKQWAVDMQLRFFLECGAELTTTCCVWNSPVSW